MLSKLRPSICALGGLPRRGMSQSLLYYFVVAARGKVLGCLARVGPVTGLTCQGCDAACATSGASCPLWRIVRRERDIYLVCRRCSARWDSESLPRAVSDGQVAAFELDEKDADFCARCSGTFRDASPWVEGSGLIRSRVSVSGVFPCVRSGMGTAEAAVYAGPVPGALCEEGE